MKSKLFKIHDRYQEFKIAEYSQTKRFLNVRSAVQARPGSPAQIKATASKRYREIFSQFHSIYLDFTRFPDWSVGKSRGNALHFFKNQTTLGYRGLCEEGYLSY
jgi:hypothetical protein